MCFKPLVIPSPWLICEKTAPIELVEEEPDVGARIEARRDSADGGGGGGGGGPPVPGDGVRAGGGGLFVVAVREDDGEVTGL